MQRADYGIEGMQHGGSRNNKYEAPAYDMQDKLEAIFASNGTVCQ